MRVKKAMGKWATAAAMLGALWCGEASGQWPHWRGPAQDGWSRESGLPESWSPAGENLAWKLDIGGRSTPVVLGDRVYLLTRGGKGPTEHELLLCLSAADGKVLWERKLPLFLTDIPSNRVGWTSPAGDPETGNVYVHGTQGLFLALDREGKLLWQRSLTEEFGRFSGYGGRLHTPLVDEDLVIISFLNSSWGDQGPMWHRFLAFDKRTGEPRWWSAPGGRPLDTNYSVPVVAVVNGVRLLVTGGGDGAVHALKVRTGEPVWHFRLSKRGVNSSVVVEGNSVFASHSEENIDTTTMGRLVAIDATGKGDVTATKELWRVDGLMAGYASPVVRQGKLYIVDNSANLECLTTKDGKSLWKHSLGTVGKGSAVWADGKLYVGEVNGSFHIVRDGEKPAALDVEEFKSPDNTVVEVNGSPAVAGGRVYFSNRDHTFAMGPREARPPAPPPPPLAEPPADPSAKPARLLLVPADATLAPGEAAAFRGRLHDEAGRFLREVKELTLTLKGLRGSVEGARFTAAAGQGAAAFQSGLVEASVEGLAASARVRVIAPIPFQEDFERFEPGKTLPAGWLGLSPLKFQVVERDGSKVLKKLANNAQFQRAEVFLGRPEWSGYTIASDVLGTYARRNLPDIGLVGHRYTFLITKNQHDRKQVARLVAWLPMPRLQKDAPFEWKPETWYRMKLSVESRGEKGLVRGKVWPRSEPEPAAWTVEMEDPFPTLNGSPGLSTFTPGITERSEGPLAFFDNLEVAPNAVAAK